ncbi:MAG: DNA replication and repair protein RecF [Eubacteriales bacterium]
MIIEKFGVADYRNIQKAFITPAPGVTVLCGKNGQGKTNMLEAINIFAQGRAYRTRRERELIRGVSGMSSDYAVAEGETPPCAHLKLTWLDRELRNEQELYIARDTSKNDGSTVKKMLRNGSPITKMTDFIGRFRAVLFSPEHLSLVKGGPGERRTFLDLAISQFNPVYLGSLQRYNALLAQRNALLRDWKRTTPAMQQSLYTYSPRMAREAALITKTRDDYIRRLDEHMRNIVAEMTGGHERLRINYDGARTEEQFDKIFNDYIARDIENGTTGAGPHREDFTLIMNGVPARTLASQGQQRTVTLAMKLSEGEIARELSGEYPVFLFDDVLSEIDAGRRNYILSALDGRQVIITACEDTIKADRVYRVSLGKFSDGE